MRVRDILHVKGNDLISVEGSASLLDASKVLAAHAIGALLVLDSQRRPAGIISERDIVRLLAKKGGDCAADPVSSVMTREVITVNLDDEVQQVMNTMTERRIRHLPVMDAGKLVGLLSIGDVVKALITASATEIEHLRHYITGERG